MVAFYVKFIYDINKHTPLMYKNILCEKSGFIFYANFNILFVSVGQLWPRIITF